MVRGGWFCFKYYFTDTSLISCTLCASTKTSFVFLLLNVLFLYQVLIAKPKDLQWEHCKIEEEHGHQGRILRWKSSLVLILVKTIMGIARYRPRSRKLMYHIIAGRIIERWCVAYLPLSSDMNLPRISPILLIFSVVFSRFIALKLRIMDVEYAGHIYWNCTIWSSGER